MHASMFFSAKNNSFDAFDESGIISEHAGNLLMYLGHVQLTMPFYRQPANDNVYVIWAIYLELVFDGGWGTEVIKLVRCRAS